MVSGVPAVHPQSHAPGQCIMRSRRLLRRLQRHIQGGAGVRPVSADSSSSLDFAGRLVLVTGAGHGIGRYVAARFQRLGATVWGCDIQFDAWGAPLDGSDLVADSPLADERAVDVTQPQQVRDWVAAAEAAHGGAVFVLVNCAGGVGGLPSKGETGWEAVEDVEPEKFRRLYAINVEGVLNTVAAVAPGMKAACSGKIVNISSGAGLRPSLTGIQGYTAAKHAQIGLTKQFALELGPAGINVNGVAPGLIRSNPSTEAQWQSYSAEKQESIIQGTFIQRPGHPNDIANACVFLASELSSWVSGQILSVDGGSR